MPTTASPAALRRLAVEATNLETPSTLNTFAKNHDNLSEDDKARHEPVKVTVQAQEIRDFPTHVPFSVVVHNLTQTKG